MLISEMLKIVLKAILIDYDMGSELDMLRPALIPNI